MTRSLKGRSLLVGWSLIFSGSASAATQGPIGATSQGSVTISAQILMLVVSSAGLMGIASIAVAQPEEIVVTGKAIPQAYHAVKRSVSIKGLDLSTPAGAKEMKRRVGQAVVWICQPELSVGKQQQRDSNTCMEFAWQSARPQMYLALQAARAH